jgi:hypothetical protein
VEKRLEAISVYTNEEFICIKQPVECDEAHIIIISPEQIDVVIKWLREARKEFV